MKRRGAWRLGIGAALATATLAASATPAALAGSNGQQVDVVTLSAVHRIQVCGANQSSRWICTPIFTWNANDQTTFPIHNWWFEGNLHIWGWTPSGKEIERLGYAPPAQTGSNWVYAYWWS